MRIEDTTITTTGVNIPALGHSKPLRGASGGTTVLKCQCCSGASCLFCAPCPIRCTATAVSLCGFIFFLAHVAADGL